MTSICTPLQIAGGVSSVTARLHPNVLLSICDSYIRRNEGQDRVIGTLLGSVGSDGVIEIRNSYAVPHNESNEQVAVDIDYHRSMFELHTHVNPKEVIVGWYATGYGVHRSDTLIHDFYSNEISNPVFVVVDTAFTQSRADVSAFVSTSISLGERQLGLQFHQIPIDIRLNDIQRIGLGSSRKSSVEKITNDIEGVENTISKLQTMIDLVYRYVDDVVEGIVAADNNIGRYVSEIFTSLPNLSPETYDKLFNDSIQDMLLVLYLTNLTRTQLSLAEKLNTAAQPI